MSYKSFEVVMEGKKENNVKFSTSGAILVYYKPGWTTCAMPY